MDSFRLEIPESLTFTWDIYILTTAKKVGIHVDQVS